MSKSGSVSHATTSSEIAESAVPAGPCRIPVSVVLVSYGSGVTVSSVSFGHAATSPELEMTVSRRYGSMILPSSESLTGWIGPQNQGDRQSFDF